MATVTPGKIFTSNEIVTPANLNLLGTPAVVVADNEVTATKIAADAVTTAKIADANVTAAKIADANVTTPKLATATQQALVPAGAVMPFAMSSAPGGWLAADGVAVSRTTYSALFSAIGTTHGAGDGSTTFNLPDLRGIFVRGSGAQTVSGTAYSGTFAAKQSDAFQGHHHTTNAGVAQSFFNNGSGTAFSYALSGATVTTPLSDGTNGTPRVAAETRPANIALLYCIKV